MEENSEKKIHKVGTKQPNELGIYDMSGNLSEWCWDWYGKDYYMESEKSNPTGPNGTSHVIRGGNFGLAESSIQVASRSSTYKLPLYGYYHGYGFRIVRTK